MFVFQVLQEKKASRAPGESKALSGLTVLREKKETLDPRVPEVQYVFNVSY